MHAIIHKGQSFVPVRATVDISRQEQARATKLTNLGIEVLELENSLKLDFTTSNVSEQRKLHIRKLLVLEECVALIDSRRWTKYRLPSILKDRDWYIEMIEATRATLNEIGFR